MPHYETKFGSLAKYEKGGVDVINDDPRNYAFSNVFDVAAHATPYAKTAVGQNREYVLEAIRAEGTSGWRAAAHDETVLIMDGSVEIRLVKLDDPDDVVAPGTEGSVAVSGEPQGRPMGTIRCGRGHLALLPKGSAYRFHADAPSVMLQQTLAGDGTEFRWSEIIQTPA